MQSDVRLAHGLALAAQDELRAARQFLAMVLDDLVHRAGHGAQVGAVDVGVDVEHRLHVVVADRAELGAGLDGGQVAEHLHRRAERRAPRSRRPLMAMAARAFCGADADPVTGRLLQRGHGVEPVLRRLRGDVVADAVARIEIEVGRGLKAAAQRDQDALRHILLGQADGRGARAVHVHRHVRIVERLLDARIDGAGNIAHIVRACVSASARLP